LELEEATIRNQVNNVLGFPVYLVRGFRCESVKNSYRKYENGEQEKH